MDRLAAWLVHAYTATGAVLALLMVHFSYQHEVRTVRCLYRTAMFVAATDGRGARRLRVKERVPDLEGALLDNIVDYATYGLAPMALLWANGYLPHGAWGGVVASLRIVASCYQFCR